LTTRRRAPRNRVESSLISATARTLQPVLQEGPPMKAVLSGRAAAALVVDGDAWYRIDADHITDIQPSGPHEWRYVFGVSEDIQYLGHRFVRGDPGRTDSGGRRRALALAGVDLPGCETTRQTRHLPLTIWKRSFCDARRDGHILWKVLSSKPPFSHRLAAVRV